MDKTEQNLYIIATIIYVIRITVFFLYWLKLRNRTNLSPFFHFFIFTLFLVLPYLIIGFVTNSDKNQYRGLYYSFYIYAADFWFIISVALFFLYKYFTKSKFD